MTIQIRNPHPKNNESEICEIKLDSSATFSQMSTGKSCDKPDADCIIVKRGSTKSELWSRLQILNWDEL